MLKVKLGWIQICIQYAFIHTSLFRIAEVEDKKVRQSLQMTLLGMLCKQHQMFINIYTFFTMVLTFLQLM